jgi:hypothetical protein
MKRLLYLLPLLLLAGPLFAQTITQQPTNQSVQVGQTATFTAAVSGGPCRSFWGVSGGLSKYGAVASTFTLTIPNVTLAMNGTTVQLQLYACTGGAAQLTSTKVLLTVTAAPPQFNFNVTLAYDDGTNVVGQLVVQQLVSVDPVSKAATWQTLNTFSLANGVASGPVLWNPANPLTFSFVLNDITGSNVIASLYEAVSAVQLADIAGVGLAPKVVIRKADNTIKSFSF